MKRDHVLFRRQRLKFAPDSVALGLRPAISFSDTSSGNVPLIKAFAARSSSRCATVSRRSIRDLSFEAFRANRLRSAA
jgi:hypothetical protein